MREVFQKIKDLEAARPEVRRSNVWHVEKIRHEEAGELLEVTDNDPSPEQLALMLKEGSDVILNVLSIYTNCGVSAEVATQALLCKLDELEGRPAEAFTRPIRTNGVLFPNPFLVGEIISLTAD